ncbi:MAG TPA: ATP-dependent 6-phosphofructokinase [Caldithrix abyssi]|uniref:ATP-dependent 6-phosphofructokinase n=1 Tax=Caldithrix abyssi TaxID=187145 RepID=A0A7V5PN37_CALAY|nr:ATP-dependent 6-phosphofructokinase [Caldithrix abyssi]
MKHRLLVLTGGGDCPGLNAVIRGIVKRSSKERNWEILGSYQAFNGVLRDPMELIVLDEKKVSGIHVKGGTIIGTTNKGGPFSWPVRNPDGTWTTVDRSDELIRRLQYQNIEAVINIGGDGSQRISLGLYEKGLNIIGVPKTIDNDLAGTDFTFGFQTAVEIATDAVDKLVTTAESHNRIFILEVMGRDAGWIALHAAVGGGAEVCLIPEIPYHVDKVIERINERIVNDRGFLIIVIAEGAKPVGGDVVAEELDEVGYQHKHLGGAASRLKKELKDAGCEHDIRVTILGHLQRGGIPSAYDRILATQFGVKAFEMVLAGDFGKMVSYKHPRIVSVPIKDAISVYNRIEPDDQLLHTARGIGICMGD